MSVLTKAQFLALYGQPAGTTFPDNTTQEISENDVRQFGQDLPDSFMSLSDNFIDEDSFASDSATKAPSQQSTKAYIASQIGSAGISNSAINNEITKSDGTDIVGTKVYSSTNGSLILGDSGLVTASRSITAEGSGANVSIEFITKGSGGYSFTTAGGNFSVLGNDSTTITNLQSGSGTNNIVRSILSRRITSGTATTGFGISHEVELESGSGGLPIAAAWQYSWADATNASEDVIITLRGIVAGSLTTHMQWSSGNFGAFGVTPVGRQLVPTGSSTDDVITALQNLGWFRQS